MTTPNTNGLSGKILWGIVAALGALVLFLAGITTNATMARVSTIESVQAQQAELNRDREARISRLEAAVPQMSEQLDRIERKLDRHMEE